MNEEDYIANRLDEQIDWYDLKSSLHQRLYKRLRFLEILLAASIPFLVGFVANWPRVNVVVGLCGVGVTVISGMLALNQYQENWVRYRGTCEALRRERFRYLTQTAPYDGDDAFPRMVSAVESLLSSENSLWSEHSKSAPEKPQ